MDPIEEVNKRTVWTHNKASVWKDVFASVLELGQDGKVETISDMFNGITAGAIRAVPKGPNVTESFRSGKGVDIQHWIMLVPMPADVVSSEYVMEFISNFHDLCKKNISGLPMKLVLVLLLHILECSVKFQKMATTGMYLMMQVTKKFLSSQIPVYLQYLLTKPSIKLSL